MNIATARLALPETVVLPESVEQCFQLYRQDDVFGLGDYCREAGYSETVLTTPEAMRLMLGDTVFDGPCARFTTALVDALRELRNTMKRYPGRQALVLTQLDDTGCIVDVLVRQNLEANPPYTLITSR